MTTKKLKAKFLFENASVKKWVTRVKTGPLYLLLVPAQLWAPFIIRGIEAGAPLSFQAMYISEGISLLLLSVFFLKAKQGSPLNSVGLRSWVFAIALGAAPLLILFSEYLPQPIAIVLGAIIGAVGRMWFYLWCISFYEKLDLEDGIRCAILSFLASIVFRMILEMLPYEVALSIIALLPLLFVAMLSNAERSMEMFSAESEQQESLISLRSVFPFVLESVLFGLVMGLYRLSASIWQASIEANAVNLLLKIVFLLILLALLSYSKTKVFFLKTNTQLQIALFFIVAAVTFITFAYVSQGNMIMAAVVVDFARYSIGISLIMISLILAKRYHISSVLALCICWTPYALAFGVGFIVRNQFDTAILYTETYILNIAFLIIAGTFVVLNVINGAEERLFSIDGIRAQKINQFDYINKQCEKVAEDDNLTPRELEIMQMICKGRSKRYIAEHYVISENTVRWHAKNLYVKLGVNSRQELLDLIDIE